MKKVLVRAYQRLNLGDDLFLKILSDRYPDISFYLLSDKRLPKVGVYSRYGNIHTESFMIRCIRKLALLFNFSIIESILITIYHRLFRRILSQFDSYIYIGGSLFIQNRNHIGIADKRNAILFKEARHSFIIGANFGPYSSEEFVRFYNDAFKNCDSVTFRDSFSRDLFPKLQNVSVSPDVVFQLPVTNCHRILNSVGLSIIDLYSRADLSIYADDYERFIRNCVSSLLSHDKEVYVFSFCKAEGDEIAINRILGKDARVHRVFYNGDIDEFLALYSSMESMLCTRFHSMILSMVYGQKFIPITYSNKMRQVLNDLKFHDFTIDVQDMDYKISREIDSYIGMCSFSLSDEIRKQSIMMFDGFDNWLKNN